MKFLKKLNLERSKLKFQKTYKLSEAKKAHEELESRKVVGSSNINSLMHKTVISPCISICKSDPLTNYCYGCARTPEEKKMWKDENTTHEWKFNNLKEIKKTNARLAIKTLKNPIVTKLKMVFHYLKKNS